MPAPEREERSVELYVRSLSPGETGRQQDEVVRRLDGLLDEGIIDDYDVRVWGDRIRRASPCARTVDGRHVRDRLGRIRAWADERGRSLDGVYREVDCESTITGESWTEVRFPQLALAEFVDGELVEFAPAVVPAENRVVTVADRLADLREEVETEPPESDAPGSEGVEDEPTDAAAAEGGNENENGNGDGEPVENGNGDGEPVESETATDDERGLEVGPASR
jgi:DNA-binding Lrp family transcriptional regulator